MLHHSLDGASRRERILWKLARPFLPARTRWFYEGNLHVRGQLWRAERELLYNTVRQARPQTAFEVGTWRGGGSTLFIAQALHDNGQGTLYTCETDAAMQAQAVENYKTHLPDLNPFVRFFLGASTDVYPAVLQSVEQIDLLLLDGAEDAAQTRRELKMFLPFLRPGAWLLAHDWNTDKTAKVKPLLSDPAHWETVHILQPPRSLGFAVLRRR